MTRKEFNEKGTELLEAIWNYRVSFPNGYPQLLEYARELFEELVDVPE